ncbi:MAG: glycosyltransferase family 2 protein [Candidatus Komeilibacteria bacterium]
MEKELSIIIVSWNVAQDLRACLLSIQKFVHIDYEVIVVDNASDDDTVHMIRHDFPMVKLIVNKSNVGFAAANNQALTKATGKYILWLNPDTEFRDDHSVVGALNFLKNQPQIGILGINVRNSDGSQQICVRRYPTLGSQLLTLLKLNTVLPVLNSRYLALDFDYSRSQTVDSIIGACMFMPRQTALSLQGFDEHFFIWFEEVDLCKRVQKFGQHVYYYADSTVIHHGGQSFSQWLTKDKQKQFNRSLLYYFSQHCPRWQLWLLYFILPINFILTTLQSILKIKKSAY